MRRDPAKFIHRGGHAGGAGSRLRLVRLVARDPGIGGRCPCPYNGEGEGLRDAGVHRDVLCSSDRLRLAARQALVDV